MAILTMYCSMKREKENDVCLPEVSISSSVFTKGLQGETFLRLWNEWDPKVWWTSVKQFYVRSRLWNDNLPQIRPCFYQQQRQLAKNNIPEPCSTILVGGGSNQNRNIWTHQFQNQGFFFWLRRGRGRSKKFFGSHLATTLCNLTSITQKCLI